MSTIVAECRTANSRMRTDLDHQILDDRCRKIYPLLLAAVRNGLGRRLRAKVDASDVVQAAFGTVLFSARAYDQESQLRQALFAAAHSRVRSLARYHRAQRRDDRREVPLRDSGHEAASHSVDPSPSPPEVAIAREEWNAVCSAVQGLPFSQRRLFMELERGRVRHDPRSSRFGRSHETVRRTYWRAVANLRSRLGSLGRRDAEIHERRAGSRAKA